MLRKLLIPRYYFAFYTNQYHRASIFENGKEIVYDANIAEYGPLAQVHYMILTFEKGISIKKMDSQRRSSSENLYYWYPLITSTLVADLKINSHEKVIRRKWTGRIVQKKHD